MQRVVFVGVEEFGRNVFERFVAVVKALDVSVERSLIDGFFAPNARTTSTDEIRARYKKTGFDPAGVIRQPLTDLFSRMTGMVEPSIMPRRWLLTAALVGAAVVLLGVVLFARQADGVVALVFAGAVLIPGFIFSRIQSAFWRRRVVRPLPHLLRMLLPMATMIAAYCWVLSTGYATLGLLALTGMALLLVAAFGSVLNGAYSTSTKERLLLRKQLAAAREYCRLELRKPTPALDDDWYPYLLAFGLGRYVDKWFRAFGGAPAISGSGSDVPTTTHGSAGATSGSREGAFSGFGGGGGFSGAGATVAFGSAVGAISSGVSAPRSSSSGGSRSSGGGSSGGGGGGGW